MVQHQGVLRELGRRLRERRLALGLGGGEAAAAAGVSRRTLTALEAGRGNPTLLVLLRLADALAIPPADLLRASPPRARERIALVGLRGAGKSTVGRLLARELEVPFVELDRRVEELAGVGLGALFDLHGADAFHRLEAEALEQVLSEGERVVLAAGGGIVDAPATFERLRATCATVWLRAEPEDHFRRVLAQDPRPMAGRPRAREELEAILARRAPLYARCDRVVDTSGRAPEEIARQLAALAREEAAA